MGRLLAPRQNAWRLNSGTAVAVGEIGEMVVDPNVVGSVTDMGAYGGPTSFNEMADEPGGCNSLLICSMVQAAIGVGTNVYGFIRIIGESPVSLNGGKKYLDGVTSGFCTAIGGCDVVVLDTQADVLLGGKTVVVLEQNGLYVVTGGAIVVTGGMYL